jgi:hypothetical protein
MGASMVTAVVTAVAMVESVTEVEAKTDRDWGEPGPAVVIGIVIIIGGCW